MEHPEREPRSNLDDLHHLNNMAVQLFRNISKHHPANENLVLCPPAIFLNLYEIYLGSRGRTHEELDAFFEASPASLTALTEDIRNFIDLGHSSRRNRHYNWHTGSRIMATPQTDFDPRFTQAIDKVTGRGIGHIDSRDELNVSLDRLTAELTEDRLSGADAAPRAISAGEKEALGAITKAWGKDPDAAFLMSAAHFHADWEAKFMKRASSNYEGRMRQNVQALTATVEPFHNADGSVVDVIMVHLQEKIFLTRDENLKVTIAEIPLSHYSMNMTVILPDDAKSGLKNFENNFTCETLEILRKDWQMPQTHVYFPKFALESHLGLSKALQSMGLKGLFTPQSNGDLSPAGNGKLHIVEAIHKAGVEISAETGEPLPPRQPRAGECSVMRPDTFARGLRLDRPFLFFITARHPEVWCFMGKVVDLTHTVNPEVWSHHKRKDRTEFNE
ncbi:leukocyte elastase inhibitor-like isoform X2 [Paramacrobiotus metropolitanus]|nr:leukocyte elastase inhibitor-like isoform X2 [Paramacrobiotus metropolitanus]